MTKLITLTIPNDDHIALRAFGKALEEMAREREPQRITVSPEKGQELTRLFKAEFAQERMNAAAEQLQQMDALRFEGDELQGPEIDTTAQQVEALAVPVEANGATYETDLGSDNPQAVPVSDSTGTPWDERIHSASKALNADGTWRLRRKPKDMDELEWSDYVSLIKADLQYPVECGGEEEQVDQEHYAAETAEGVNDIEPPVTPPGDDFHTDTGIVTEQTVVGIPPIPVPPPVVVPPAPVDDAWTFPKLMTFLTERQGKIDVATVNMLLAQDGIASLPELNAHPDKIGPFVARVKTHLGE